MRCFYIQVLFMSAVGVSFLFDIYVIHTLKPVEYTEAYDCAKDKIRHALKHDIYIDFMKDVFNISKTMNIKSGWNKTLQCLHNSSVYYPFIAPKDNTMAFVYPRLDFFYPGRIYVNKEHFDEITLNEQANVLIHECTHLAFDTSDYAYSYESKFDGLRGRKAFKNADTHVSIINSIKDNCYF